MAAAGAKNLHSFDLLGSGGPLLGQKGLQLTAPEGCVGLRREPVDFPCTQNVETLILVILGLN